MRWTLLLLCALLAIALGCRPGAKPTSQGAPRNPVDAADDLATARKGFETKLRVRGPAPQPFQNATPPTGVKQVEFMSGDLKLKGWLSADANDGKKRAAV